MSALSNPLVLIGLGPMGMRVVRDLDDTAKAVRGGDAVPHAVIVSLGDRQTSIRRSFAEQTSLLLETGASSTGGQARLDIVVVADALEMAPPTLADTVQSLTDVLADDFPVLFPPTASVEQRSVWLTVLLGTPALVATPQGQAFIERIRALRDRRATLRHPALSRVVLLPRQTTGGRLSDEGLEASLRATLQTVYLSGCRDDDRIRRVIGHRTDDAWLTQVSVATAELPIAKIRRYARWRLALAGLQTLVEQAELPTTDPSRAEALRQQLDPDALLADFVDGPPADRVRARAAQISGAEDHLPTSWRVSLTERPLDLRARFRVLFEPIAKPWSRRIDPTNDPDHQAMLRLMDAVEADTLNAADRRLTSLLDEQLEPSTALRVLPALEHALKQAVHTLDEELAASTEPLPSPEPPPPPVDPGLHVLEHAIDGRPGIRSTWPVLFALTSGLAVSIVLVLTWLVLPSTASTVTSAPLPPTTAEAWAVGLLIGLFAAALWQLGVLWVWRTEAQAALTKRTHELEAAWRLGGAGQERHQADQLLAVRRRRTANDLRRRYGAALERLAGLRAALRQSANEAAGALSDLRVRLGPLPANDDLSGLIGTDTPLHGSLIAPELLAERLDSLGLHRDLQRWAGQILADTWPSLGGLEEDLPCVEIDAILAACDQAIGALSTSALLGSDAASTSRTREFLRTGVPALAWGVEPRDRHGDPVRGSGRDRRLLIASAAVRASVEGALADSPMQLDTCWSASAVPWVSVIAFWEGHTTEDIERGMGVTE